MMSHPKKTLLRLRSAAELVSYIWHKPLHGPKRCDARCANVILAFKGDVNELMPASAFPGIVPHKDRTKLWTVLMVLLKWRLPLSLIAMGKRGDVNPMVQPNWDGNAVTLAVRYGVLHMLLMAFPQLELSHAVLVSCARTVFRADVHQYDYTMLYELLEHWNGARDELLLIADTVRRRAVDRMTRDVGTEERAAEILSECADNTASTKANFDAIVRFITDARNSDEACAMLVTDTHNISALGYGYCSNTPLTAAIVYRRALTIHALASVMQECWSAINVRGMFPLVLAAMLDNGMAEVLLDAFPDMTVDTCVARALKSATALHMAAAWGNTALAVRLVARGQVRTRRDSDVHFTAETLARVCRHYDTAEAIRTCTGPIGDIPRLSDKSRSLLHVIQDCQHTDEAIAVAARGVSQPDVSCVLAAVQHRLPLTLRALAAHPCAKQYPTDVLVNALQRAVDEQNMLRVFLEAFHSRCLVNCLTEQTKHVALHRAVVRGKMQQVEVLLEYGADTQLLYRRDHGASIPLYVLANMHGQWEMVELFARYDRCMAEQRFSWLRACIAIATVLPTHAARGPARKVASRRV